MATFTTLVYTAAAIGVLFLLWIRLGTAKSDHRPESVSNPWATTKELRPFMADKPAPGQLILGKVNKGRKHYTLVLGRAEHSAMIIGGARCGKTTGFLAPNVVEWVGPALVVSTKSDALSLTLTDADDAVLFAPALNPASMAVNRVPLVGYSPADGISELWEAGRRDEAEAEASLIAKATCAGTAMKGVESGDFWQATAAALLAPLLLALAITNDTENTIDDLLRWASAGDELSEPLDILLRYNAAPTLQMELTRFLGNDARIQSSTLTTLGTALMAYKNPLIRATAKMPRERRIRPSWLYDPAGVRRRLYLLGTPMQQDELAPIFTALLDELVRSRFDAVEPIMMQRAPGDDSCVVAPERHLLMALDEVANIFPYPKLPTLLSTGGSNGITVMLVYQDLAQARARLGEDAVQTLLNNAQATVIMRGIKDTATLTNVTSMLGTQFVKMTGTSTSKGQTTNSVNVTERTVAATNEIRQLELGQTIVIYSSEKPFRLGLLNPPKVNRQAAPTQAASVLPLDEASVT